MDGDKRVFILCLTAVCQEDEKTNNVTTMVETVTENSKEQAQVKADQLKDGLSSSEEIISVEVKIAELTIEDVLPLCEKYYKSKSKTE